MNLEYVRYVVLLKEKGVKIPKEVEKRVANNEVTKEDIKTIEEFVICHLKR